MRAGQLLRLGYRLLLRPFPRRYRAEYQSELEDVVGQLAADEAQRGRWAVARLIGRELRDLPAALLREYRREWRQRAVNANALAASPEEPVAGWRWLAVLAPFLIASGLILASLLPASAARLAWMGPLIVIGILAYLLLTLVASVRMGLPRWTLPGVGMSLAVLLYLFLAMGSSVAPQLDVRVIPWPTSNLGRVVSQTAQYLFGFLPVVIVCAALVLLAAWLGPLRTLSQRLRRDWSLLSFLLYSLALMPILFQDEYRGLELYQIAGLAALAGGAWAYLRQGRPGRRLLVLLAGLVLAMVILSLGIYRLYPLQAWAAHTTFPRWWEAANPLMHGFALAVVLSLPAALKLLPPGRAPSIQPAV